MSATYRVFPAVLLAAALLGVFPLSACGGAESRRASHMERGQRYYAEGNFEKARVEFGNALQIAPNNAEARFMAGRVAEKLGNIRGAVGMYQAAIDVNSDYVQARANLGRVFVFAGAPDQALAVIKPGLDKHPEDPDLLTVRGAIHAQKKETADAIADAEHAVKVAPDNENAVALLASLYRQNNEPERAVELLNKTLQALPTAVDLRQVLANLYLSVGDTRSAEAQLVQVVKTHPKDLQVRYQLALFYVSQKRLDDAERAFKEAMAAAPDSDDARLAYVDFLSSQRSREQAERTLKDFIAQRPKDYDLQLGLGTLQQRSGDSAAALNTYRAIIAKEPGSPKALTARDRIAAIEAARGHPDEALREVAEVLKKNPRDNDALTIRGDISQERGDLTAAIADFRAVLRDQPNLVPVLRALARAHIANSEPALGEENLRAAMAAAPADSSIRVELAELLEQTQRADQAVSLLEETVLAAPDKPGLREALTKAYIAKQDLSAARTAAEDLKQLRPDLAVGYFLSGLIAQAQSRPDDAQKDLEHALQIQPTAMDALAALARLETSRGHRDAAITRVRRFLDTNTRNAVAENLLGELYLAGKDYSSALPVLNDAVATAPKWWMPYRTLAAAKLATNDVSGAVSTYEAGVKATGEPGLVADLAALYERQDRIDDAIKQYEALHERKPHLDLAANNLAMLLVTYRKDQPSLDRARDLTASFGTSDNASLLDTHGWVRFKRGEINEALSALQKAATQSPGSKVILYHLGMAQLKAGQRDKARSSLEAALAGTGTFAGSDEARTALAELKGHA